MQLLDCHWLISALGECGLLRWMTTPWNASLVKRHLRRFPQLNSSLVLFVSICFSSSATIAIDTVVICPTAFRSALQPWCEYREKQGHKFQFVVPGPTAGLTRATILALPLRSQIKAILIVGDAPSFVRGDTDSKLPSKSPSSAASVQVPTFYHRAKVNVLFGSAPEIASDSHYADFDGDGRVDVALGRLPVENSQQLTELVQRIISYEVDYVNHASKRNVHFIAGVGGFGPLADGLIDAISRRLIGGGIPDSLNVSMTYASWQSPYCPAPTEFSAFTIDRFNEGGLFWVYMGHGQSSQLDALRTPESPPLPIFRSSDTAKLKVRGVPPICVFLACNTGAFDGPRASIGEQMLLAPEGAIAVLAATRVTMPYAMSVMGDSMLNQAFKYRRETLGEIILLAKQELVAATGESVSPNRRLLDQIAAVTSPDSDLLKEERQEHSWMFNLLGDPLLRVNYPDGIRVKCAAIVNNGKKLQVTFDSPIVGKAVVEIVTQRGSQREQLIERNINKLKSTPKSDRWNGYSKEYEMANDPVWVSAGREVQIGPQAIDVLVEDVSSGLQTVRVVIYGKRRLINGSTRVFVTDR
ncbi:MAG: C25 family cysteine peptidase [Pirellulaceae bacterium]|nr:C25 family cysteine peptidase [Pirellulaceae bacterium]